MNQSYGNIHKHVSIKNGYLIYFNCDPTFDKVYKRLELPIGKVLICTQIWKLSRVSLNLKLPHAAL